MVLNLPLADGPWYGAMAHAMGRGGLEGRWTGGRPGQGRFHTAF